MCVSCTTTCLAVWTFVEILKMSNLVVTNFSIVFKVKNDGKKFHFILLKFKCTSGDPKFNYKLKMFSEVCILIY